MSFAYFLDNRRKNGVERIQFTQKTIKERDQGFDFYDSQSTQLNYNTYYSIAWMQNWSASIPKIEKSIVGLVK